MTEETEETKRLRESNKTAKELSDLVISNNDLKEDVIYPLDFLDPDDSQCLDGRDVVTYFRIRPESERHKLHDEDLEEMIEYKKKIEEKAREKVKFS